MRCPSCDLEFKSYTSVSLHYRNKHGSGAQFREVMRQKYVDEHHGGVVPVCKCGCGGTPKYYDYERGYVDFVRGHQSRVNNNWGHNKQALQKSQDTRREQISSGEWSPWNRGLTGETDARVRNNNEAVRASILSNPDECISRSKRMTKNRLTGVVRTLYGKEHPNWKGGASALQPLVRSRLHSVWVYPKLKASCFTCQMCSSPGPGLEVHHDQERFAAILQKAIAIFGEVDDSRADEDFEKKSAIAEWVAGYHVENNVSGLVLCAGCHANVHVL